MALAESTVLASVNLNITSNAIEVRWDNLIQRDGEIISRVPHRKAYNQDQKSEFLAEVEGGQAYADAMDW
jgi:hypothetical protein